MTKVYYQNQISNIYANLFTIKTFKLPKKFRFLLLFI